MDIEIFRGHDSDLYWNIISAVCDGLFGIYIQGVASRLTSMVRQSMANPSDLSSEAVRASCIILIE